MDRLLDMGANINDKNILNYSLSAISLRASSDGLTTLIRRGANPNTIIHKEPLMWHVAYGYMLFDELENTMIDKSIETLEFLLNHGAEINLQNTHGDNILTCVVDPTIFSFLLSKGANFYLPNKSGKTPYDKLRSYQSRDTHVSYLNRWPTTMGIIMLKEIGLYQHLDCDTFMDLYDFTFDDFLQLNDDDMY